MKRYHKMAIGTVLFVFVVTLVFVSPAKADFIFTEPVNLKTVIPFLDDGTEQVDCLSRDGLEMYISSYQRPGGRGHVDLWVLRRTSIEAYLGFPENLGPAVNSVKEDSLASISADGLTLYFSSNRVGADYDYDIYMTTRATKDAPWGPAENLGPVVNSHNHTDGEPWISPDGLELYFESYRPGGNGFSDIYVTRRANVNSPWGIPTNVGPLVNSEYHEQFLSLSPDGLVLLFGETRDAPWRPGGYGGADIWMTRRASLADSWQLPVNLGPRINGLDRENIPRISPDGRTLYFCSNHGGNWNNYQAPIIPIADFNGDYQIDIQDLVILIEHWGSNETLCDIGPMAWGDGVIDEADLEVLMSYWGQALFDPHFIGHWKLDETEGMFAMDNVGENDGLVVGGPVWRPEEGQVNGALEFDGIDDMIVLKPVLNPEEGPFSVFAWVKGGGPGEVILSQRPGENWLMVDEDGKLLTELKDTSRHPTVLYSESVITDGNWHKIGFVWDGVQRSLYVDGVEVAYDVVGPLGSSKGGLYIGAGNDPKSARFWSGLIDDVRIYDRSVRP